MKFSIDIILPLVLGLCIWLFPYKAPKTLSKQHFGTLHSKYKKWDSIGLLFLFILVPSMTWLFGELFLIINSLALSKKPGLIYEVVPDLMWWCIPALILSFGLVTFPMMFFYKSLLEDKYEEYMSYSNMKNGFDGMRVSHSIALALGILSAAILLFISDYTIEIYKDKLVINDLTSISKNNSYNFSQIQSINFVQNIKTSTKITPCPHFLILFTDGNSWNTNSELNDETNQAAIIKILTSGSHQKIKTLSYDPD